MKKIKKVTYNEMEDNDLDTLIQTEYGIKGYCFVADQECGNDSQHSFTVEKEPLDKWEQDDLAKFKSGKHVGMITATLLKDLVNQDKLDEGEYLITVCW